jgi:hypothetical protein
VRRNEKTDAARRPWTAPDDRKLREMLDAGAEAAEIALKLKRTRGAVYIPGSAIMRGSGTSLSNEVERGPIKKPDLRG